MAISASEIASWLKAQRERLGLTQMEVSRRAGLSSDYISKWERGERGIMAENFVTLCIVYGADPRSLVSDDLRMVAEPPPLAQYEATREVEDIARRRGQKKSATRK